MPRPDESPDLPPMLPQADTDQVLPLGGGYHLHKRLGAGAFGEVWLAEAPGGVKVAVKIISRALKKDQAGRELDALQLIKELRHPYLLSLQAYFSLPDRLVIVMELADGSLRGRLDELEEAGQRRIEPLELLRYTREAAEALDYLHEHSIQHRDIKPDNLLVLGRHVKVADFGLARLLEKASLQSATQIGTPAYMAPEVWGKKASVHSDQYSLAVTYAELRLGRFPFDYQNLPQLMYAHLNIQPNLAPLGEQERSVLSRALAKDPEGRFPSCTAFVQALAQAMMKDGEASTNKRSGTSPPRPPVERPSIAPSTRISQKPMRAGGDEREQDTGELTSKTRLDGPPPKSPARGLAQRPGLMGVLVAVPLLLAIAVIGWSLAGRGKTTDTTNPDPTKPTGLASGALRPEGQDGPGDSAQRLKKSDAANLVTTKPGGLAGGTSKSGGRASLGEGVPVLGKERTNSIGMKLILIAIGSFTMGSTEYDYEKPLHVVNIRQPFCMAETHTTQAQFEKVLGRNPSFFSSGGKFREKKVGQDTTDFAVENISFFDAIEFCIVLSEREKLRPWYRLSEIKRDEGAIKSATLEILSDGTGYRLPSEAEWEYCARAGSTSKYCFGDVVGRLREYAWFKANSGGTMQPVRKKKPNAWGLYDMHGLAWQWCEDVYHDSYQGGPTDGSAWRTDPNQGPHVRRGGAFHDRGEHCGSSHRVKAPPGFRGSGGGFRVVLAPP